MTADLKLSLQSNFGFNSFRPGQAEAIQSLLNGKHTLVVMPTGSGKSLIFQLSALHMQGITLVISPLIALMKDQVDSLIRRSISATFINSTLNGNEQNRRLQDLSAGKYRLVYVAPERLRSIHFPNGLKGQKVSLLAVDEAHCISEWGHDFRPDYLHIARFRAALGNPLTAALTATATPQVQADITRLLGLPEARRIVTGFNRPNLALEVRYVANLSARLKILRELLSDQLDGGTIIYTGTRRDAEEVADFVKTMVGINSRYYHAGLPTEERSNIQDEFMAGDLPVVVATNAFGMGIDRPDVRQVVHYSMPGSLESYYQEAGRAGRDELPARAILLYSPEDRALQEWFIENGTISQEDLRLLYDALRPDSNGQISITIDDLSRLTGLQEVKVRVGLAELERAGMLDRLGDEGLRVLLHLHGWKRLEIQAVAERLKQHQQHRKAQLELMILYAETNACRRRVILNHFGDPGDDEAEVCCDNCQARRIAPSPTNNIGTLTQSDRVPLVVLDTVRRLKRSVGIEKIAQILKGSRAQDILHFGYDKSPYYGRLAVFTLAQIKALIDQLLELGYLKMIGGEYPVLHLTPQGEAAICDKVAIPIKLPRQLLYKKVESKKSEQQAGGTNIIAAAILNCVRVLPGKLPCSGVARLLVGSESERVKGFRAHPLFNLLGGHSRSDVMDEEDRLLSIGQLAKDENGHLIPGNAKKTTLPIEAPAKVEIQKVVALGESKSESAIPELVAYLGHPNDNVRRLAASALGKIGNGRATAPLMNILSHEERPQVRQYAVKALGQIGDLEAKSLLKAIAGDDHEKDYTRQSARIALKGLSARRQTTLASKPKTQQWTVNPPTDPIAAFLTRPHPRQLPGLWSSGWALGFHSQFAGSDWSRSDVGELTHRLKYQGDLSVLPALVDHTEALIADRPELAQVDAVVPVPPSTSRPVDPVSSFAKALAERLGLAFLPVLVKSRQTTPQKQMHTLAQKRANVAGAFDLQSPIKGQRLLVVDDLFDSGATLEEITHLLSRAGATRVCVLTLTRTIHSDA